MNDGKERDNEPGRRKSWTENWWVWYGYGAGMGAMSAVFFLAQGIRLLNEGHLWPGIVSLILAVVFPTATMWESAGCGNDRRDADPGGHRGGR